MGEKTCYISCILGHATSYIDQFLVHLPQLLILLTAVPTVTVKHYDKNIPLWFFRVGLGARSRTLTDVSIMVMAKSCLNQTQHSGLTIAANGHICHGTKMGALSVCAACVKCVFALCVCGSLNKTKKKSQLVLLAELKIVFTDRE